MTIQTNNHKTITDAVETSGVTIDTLKQISGNDWMVVLSAGTNDPKTALMSFLGALFTADPTARAMVGQTSVDAGAFAAKMAAMAY